MDKLRKKVEKQNIAESLLKKKKSNACGLHCIKIKDFAVTVGNDRILENVSLHVHCGQLTTVIGKNGAGKSTLIKAILNEIPHEGTIEFRDIKNKAFQDLKIGYVPQHLNIAKNTPTSVYDLLASYITNIPVFFRKSRRVYEKIKKQLEQFEAAELIDKAVCDLSGGELQRVLLSLATMPVPNLLILDEPVSGIDKNGMELFYKQIDYLKKTRDLAVILVSHDLEYVEKYSDHVILLDKTIIKEGRPKEVFRSEEFKEAFGTYALIS